MESDNQRMSKRMTYRELELEFYLEYADRNGIICATPVELYKDICELAFERKDEEIVWEELVQYLREKDYNNFCIEDVKVCVKRKVKVS